MKHLHLFLGGIVILAVGIFLGITLLLFLSQEPPSNFKELNNYENSILVTFVAVDAEGEGVTADLITEVREGTGLILVNVNDVLADVNTQFSARTAANVASNFTKISLDNLDIVYNLQTEATLVGGPSAGTIMAISTIAVLENKTLKKHVIATGSISSEGEILGASGLIAKAQAAHDSNFTLFLVPDGLGNNPVELKREKSCRKTITGKYCSVEYVNEEVSIGEDIGIAVQEVKTVAEAWEYFRA